ncbi:protein erfk [[Actinobacillus] muris]|uniref:Protein erfk n=1 Tax=Muribacter muris TaxID=67855 RepID=A0A0J5P5F3_9PAST|nr:L,D-transpeptidase family protein [Muribacter muris]KMK50975.1 protein erfk [[Actinobacillus] muris] [Muribacter muris]
MKKAIFILIGLLVVLVGFNLPKVKQIMSDILPDYLAGELAIAADTSIDRLVVFKHKRQMWAYRGEQLVKIYPIALGFNPIGHKQFEGDGKTPEGIYRINERNPRSAYHKNLGVSYPNAQDTAYAQSQGKSPGGLIKIHGLPNGRGDIGKLHLLKDWTHGCIAVTNEEIDELYRTVIHNAVIDIRP